MLKTKHIEFIKRMSLRLTKITHGDLIVLGFDDSALYYRLVDLNIYVAEGRFFYHKPSGKRKSLSNMLQISDLIYGKTEYLHILNHG